MKRRLPQFYPEPILSFGGVIHSPGYGGSGPAAPGSSLYKRPGGIDQYRRPGGVDLYRRPAGL
jgi:hypothetical protein